MYDKLDAKKDFNVDHEAEDKLLNDPEMRGKLSYWKNSGTEPLRNLTIYDLLEQCLSKYPNRPAVISVHQNYSLTFKQTLEQVDAFAAGLLGLGLSKGDHVGIWGLSTVEWYISFLAITSSGLVAVNLNSLYECPELQSTANKTDVKALIIGEKVNDRSYYNMMEKIIPQLSSYNYNSQIDNEQPIPTLKFLIVMSDTRHRGAYRWSDILTMATKYFARKLQRERNQIDVHEVCEIQFTSGVTGSIKGACLTHYNIVNNAYFVSKRMLLSKKHHMLCLQVPLFHTFGTSLGVAVSLNSGTTLVLPSLKFSPTKTIEAIIKEKCTILYGTPTMFIDVLTIFHKMSTTDPEINNKINSLEIALTAGALATPVLLQNMKKYLHFKKIFSGYGMTEVSPIAFFSQDTDDDNHITSTIGNVIDHVEVKVIDDAGHIVPFGVPGECCFRGYNVMKGYYKDEEINSKSFLPGGWLCSGDRFILLESGYGKVIGRIKDTIIRGGENIEPSEIETVLACHPDIVNIQVFGVSDVRLGETVAASIIRREKSLLNEDEVRKYCEGKIASYKIPKYMQFVEDYPRTASGKPIKLRLRENFERILDLKR